MPFAILLGIYGGWLACGLPLLKAYEAVTLPDLRERAGSRLVRRSYSFSKSVGRHLDAIHLSIATHNLKIRQATIA